MSLTSPGILTSLGIRGNPAGTRRAPGPAADRPASPVGRIPGRTTRRGRSFGRGTRPVPSVPAPASGTPPGPAARVSTWASRPVRPGPAGAYPGPGAGSARPSRPRSRAAYLPATCLPVARTRRRTRIRPGTHRHPVAVTGGRVRPLLVGAAVSIELGVFAKVHEAQPISFDVAGFSGPASMKAWLATVAAVLALTQVLSAVVMGAGSGARRALRVVHVWTGRLAVLVTVPVAVHCLYSLGFDARNARVLLHSVLGCFLYGVFVARCCCSRGNRCPVGPSPSPAASCWPRSPASGPPHRCGSSTTRARNSLRFSGVFCAPMSQKSSCRSKPGSWWGGRAPHRSPGTYCPRRTRGHRRAVARVADDNADKPDYLKRGVIARGLGRSYNESGQNSGGLTVDMTPLQRIYAIDADTATVDLDAGVSLDALMRAALPYGLWVPVLPGTRQVTIGGAIAHDIHGKNHHSQGSFGNHIVEMRLLVADGRILTLTPDGSGDDP